MVVSANFGMSAVEKEALSGFAQIFERYDAVLAVIGLTTNAKHNLDPNFYVKLGA